MNLPKKTLEDGSLSNFLKKISRWHWSNLMSLNLEIDLDNRLDTKIYIMDFFWHLLTIMGFGEGMGCLVVLF